MKEFMSGEIIRKGDPTSHGGTVLEGSMSDICHGKPIAYLGHKVYCPKCKGSYPIVEGVFTTSFYGKGVAVAGMKTACGAILIATQFTDIVETGGGAGPSELAMEHATAAGAANALVAEASSAAEQSKVKKVTAVFWSYGEDETPVTGISRYFVDLNLHVETANYLAGEMVDIVIEDDEGNDVLEGVKKLNLRGRIGPDGKAKLMNVFAGKTLITLARVEGE